MAFKLVVSNKVLTKVKGFYKDETGVSRAFNFELEQDRIDQDQLKQIVSDKHEDASDFLKRVTKGWRHQRLVLTEDDKPAEFGADAFDVLLSVAGMGGYCFQAYLAQVLVNEKN